MSERNVPTLYIRLRKRVSLPSGEPIRLGTVAQLFATGGQPSEHTIRQLELLHPQKKDGNNILIDMLLIVKKVKQLHPDIEIEQYGEPHVLVEIYRRKRPQSVLLFALVWCLLFIGSGRAIMNFHADVSMMQVHRRIVELITGKQVKHPYFLQIPYSLGIGLGMVLFFNHLFKKKFNEEPSPLELEMYMYEQNVNEYIITDEYRKMNERSDRP